MSVTYNGALGTTVNVFPSGANVSVGFTSTLVLVGEQDGGNADFNTPVAVDDVSDVEDAMGESSSLTGAFRAAKANGAGDIWVVGTDGTATDPDYSAATQAAMSILPRYVYLDSADSADKSTALGVIEDYATDLEFARLFAPVESDVATADISTYEPNANAQRYIEVAPFECTVGGETTYTAAAVAGAASTKPLGGSLAYDQITVDSLATEYRASTATDFEHVTAVTKDSVIVDGVTTSTEGAFSDIFQMEIVDTAALGLDQISQDYAGSTPNTEEERTSLRGAMRRFLESLADRNPPLLADAEGGQPYSVQVDLGSSDDEAVASVGVDPVDVMKQITINLNVGDVTTLEGVEA